MELCHLPGAQPGWDAPQRQRVDAVSNSAEVCRGRLSGFPLRSNRVGRSTARSYAPELSGCAAIADDSPVGLLDTGGRQPSIVGHRTWWQMATVTKIGRAEVRPFTPDELSSLGPSPPYTAPDVGAYTCGAISLSASIRQGAVGSSTNSQDSLCIGELERSMMSLSLHVQHWHTDGALP